MKNKSRHQSGNIRRADDVQMLGYSMVPLLELLSRILNVEQLAENAGTKSQQSFAWFSRCGYDLQALLITTIGTQSCVAALRL